ncbi:MAG: gentisate 1,2-dioxygenase [SAR324 cluster bacterium]|nr:gentisate 1,2-dioxygenase [SAR324 cluster bacterium]
MPNKVKRFQEREDFYSRISTQNMTPLWEVLDNLVLNQPEDSCVPAHWKYEELRPALMESGQLITAKEAERRVLVLENPAKRGKSRITNSLYAGYQLILPGEIAPAHRHSQSALRFVIEGNGAFTAVEGEKTLMQPGDFVVTPSWNWHDHGNQSDAPMVWVDGLDIPLVEFFNTSFKENLGEDAQMLSRPAGDALARYGSGLLPVDYESRSLNSPVFNYPYARTREALEIMRKTEEWDSCHGLKMRYVNPVDGGFAMPTMATFVQLLPKTFKSIPYRSTDATVFVVVEGSGSTLIGEENFHWNAHDVFVAPSWNWISHRAEEDAVLFSFSDRVIQEKLGLWREQRGNESI